MSFADNIVRHFDKVQHLGVGTVSMVLGGLVHPVVGQGLTLALSKLKEDYDKRRPEKHTSDGWDAFATACGILPGQLILDAWGAWMRALLGM